MSHPVGNPSLVFPGFKVTPHKGGDTPHGSTWLHTVTHGSTRLHTVPHGSTRLQAVPKRAKRLHTIR